MTRRDKKNIGNKFYINFAPNCLVWFWHHYLHAHIRVLLIYFVCMILTKLMTFGFTPDKTLLGLFDTLTTNLSLCCHNYYDSQGSQYIVNITCIQSFLQTLKL